MPRIRRQDNIHQLTEFDGQIIGMQEAGMSLQEIANKIGRNTYAMMRC